MKYDFEFKGCSEDDVLDFTDNTYKVKKVIDTIFKVFKEQSSNSLGAILYQLLNQKNIKITPEICSDKKIKIYGNWFNKGISCDLLRVGGKSWEKGRLKINISVEFIPDEIESPLDSVREEINS